MGVRPIVTSCRIMATNGDDGEPVTISAQPSVPPIKPDPALLINTGSGSMTFRFTPLSGAASGWSPTIRAPISRDLKGSQAIFIACFIILHGVFHGFSLFSLRFSCIFPCRMPRLHALPQRRPGRGAALHLRRRYGRHLHGRTGDWRSRGRPTATWRAGEAAFEPSEAPLPAKSPWNPLTSAQNWLKPLLQSPRNGLEMDLRYLFQTSYWSRIGQSPLSDVTAVICCEFRKPGSPPMNLRRSGDQSNEKVTLAWDPVTERARELVDHL